MPARHLGAVRHVASFAVGAWGALSTVALAASAAWGQPIANGSAAPPDKTAAGRMLEVKPDQAHAASALNRLFVRTAAGAPVLCR